jgi:tRNA A-37 threonylcarbamoyl transferase component Bud32
MAAPSATHQFMELVQKCGVVDPTRLDAWLQQGDPETRLAAPPAQLAGLLVKDGLLTLYQAQQLLNGRWQNFIVNDRYKVLSLLGTGGMGSVYLCEHLHMHRRVALKVLPPRLADDPVALKRFQREAIALAAVEHPNIVRAHDFRCDGPMPFLVMEYVEGTNLQELVKDHGPLAIGQAAHYLSQAAAGLEHARQVGWVHRDIKPANLLIDRSGTVKLLDMGLAKLLQDEASSVTKNFGDQSILGTADYIAPEQALNSQEVDIRTDIYSLGATFHYALTGQVLYPGATAAQKLLFHQVKSPTPLRELRADVPPALAAVIERMLAKAREGRFQTPREVVDELAPVFGELPPMKGLPGESAAPASAAGAIAMPSLEDLLPPMEGCVGATVPLAVQRRAQASRRWQRQTVAGGVVLFGGLAVFLVLLLRSTPTPTASPALAGARPTLASSAVDAFGQWQERTARLSVEQQKEAVLQKLTERNPAFDGQVKFEVKDLHVVRAELSAANVKDLAPLRALPFLSALICNGGAAGKGKLADLGALHGLTLVHLECARTQVGDLSALKGMPLQALVCATTSVADLGPLQGTKRLALLDCSQTQVWDLTPLRGSRLQVLICNDTPLVDLRPLAGMKLVALSCRGTRVRDLTPLTGMPLTQLVCHNTLVGDLGPLRNMKTLKLLDCRGTRVRDLAPLKGLALEQLHCNFDPKRDAEIVRSITTLKTINNQSAAEFWKKLDLPPKP